MDSRLASATITGLVDVDTPLVGPDGAARVFGPQKGADPATVEVLERGLDNLVRVARRDLGLTVNLATLPGGGAAGGLGAALAAFCEARLVSGVDYVMGAAGLAAQVEWCDLVITGEGALDSQSGRGKTCAGVARLAAGYGRPVFAIVGSVTGEAEAVLTLGLAGVLPLPTGPMSLIQALGGAAGYLEAAGSRLARLLLAGAGLGRPLDQARPEP